MFFLENDDQHSCLSDPADHSRLTEHVAKAFCLALCPHLKLLKEDGMTKLGLRVTLDSDQVRSQVASEAGLEQCLYFLTCDFSCINPDNLILWALWPCLLVMYLDVLLGKTLSEPFESWLPHLNVFQGLSCERGIRRGSVCEDLPPRCEWHQCSSLRLPNSAL